MFTKIFDRYAPDQVKERIYNAGTGDMKNILEREHLYDEDIFTLLSPAADSYLEEMAGLASRITRMRFGNIIQLYTPLYISNECVNSCLYCGFNKNNTIRRVTLTMDQIEHEADIIYKRGFRHVLLLTGEHKARVPVSMLAEVAKRIHSRFASVSIEVYPMETDEYTQMAASGIDGLTLYQETYDKAIYSHVHPAGRKRDFYFRLEGPDRGGLAGLRKIGIGALLGLSDWRVEGFYTALHALHLTRTYWKTQIQVSFPRLREAPGGFNPFTQVLDRDLVHLICAFRMLLPDAGLVLSTREPANLRDNLFPLGITMMSAGSSTEPGGYSGLDVADYQFHVEDGRSPEEMARVIQSRGFEPVWKDWDRDILGH